MKRKHRPSSVDARTPETAASGVQVEIGSHVIREIRRHASSSMAEEICGVLVGEVQAGRTVVRACIPGEAARQGGSHVTFTQETWSHIYSVKDSKYPDERIVGWYHSHPGFGVFLSEHDTFIHRNFFSDPNQIAWVYDPHSDEEACFAWEQGDIARLACVTIRDMGETGDSECEATFAPGDINPQPVPGERKESPRARILNIAALTASHLFALIAGVLIGSILFSQVVYVTEIKGNGPGPSIDTNQKSAPAEAGRK